MTDTTIITNPRKLFVDLDGVLVDFERGFEILHKVHPDSVPMGRMWQLINSRERHWHDLPIMPGAMRLWARIAHHNPTILTGAPAGGFKAADEGKREWVARELGPDIEVITCLSKNKINHMISPGDILVDDLLKNCTRWEEAGGVAIHYTNYDAAAARLDELGL